MSAPDSLPLDELRGACREVLDGRCPMERLADRVDGGPDLGLWAELVSLGWAGILVPETHGGLGWTWREAVVVSEELGRVLANVPFMSSALIAAGVLRSAPPSPLVDQLLAEVGSGQKTVTVAGHLPALSSRSSPPAGAALKLEEGPSGATLLDGDLHFVIDACVADILLVVVAGAHGPDVMIVDLDQPGVTVVRTPTVDATRDAATVELRKATGSHVATADAAVPLAQVMLDAAALALAADSVGVARVTLERTIDYAVHRVQFGRPIGSFQAIKHRLADLYLLVQGSIAAVEGAAARPALPFAQSDTTAMDTAGASLAYAYATDAAARVAGDAILVHGAIGFTWEHDLHRYLKRANFSRMLAGPTTWHRDHFLSETLHLVN